MISEALAIPVDHPKISEVAGLLQTPQGKTPGLYVLLAHGAGAPMESEFMSFVAEGFVERGYGVLRFRYIYMERSAREQRRFPPDRSPTLISTHRAALGALADRVGPAPIVLAGKSMGGRMASLMAAEGVDCAGLMYLGYPLHPAGKPERLRSEHFPRIQQHSLFMQGTRDALCDLNLLKCELKNYAGPWQLAITEGGDHSFDVLKRSGTSREQVRQQLMDDMVGWLRGRESGNPRQKAKPGS